MIVILKHLEVYRNAIRDKPFLDSHGSIADFPDDDNSALLKFKRKIAGRIVNNCTKNVKIIT